MEAHDHKPAAEHAHEAGHVGPVPLLKQFVELGAVADVDVERVVVPPE